MYLAKVMGPVVCTVKHPAYEGKPMLLISELGAGEADYEIAVDYVGAGVGDIVIVGGAPGVAQSIFGLDKAPIKTLIMGIVDSM
ncbi:MAG: EutN/CcmL family microcompartment protein [Firmicutes bacterium]|nr:EutN/CcmL family microcompartment protein [Bacillota bacterium]